MSDQGRERGLVTWTEGMLSFAVQVDDERRRQLADRPDRQREDGTNDDFEGGFRVLRDTYRRRVERLRREGAAEPTWLLLLLREVFEAACEADEDRLRLELVQLAAVCAAWLSDLERRETGRRVGYPPFPGVEPSTRAEDPSQGLS